MTISRRRLVGAGAMMAASSRLLGCGNSVTPAPLVLERATLQNGKLQVQIKVIDAEGQLVDHYPDLSPIGGAITIDIGPASAGVPDAILLIHLADSTDGQPTYVALNSACPHAGCPLGYSTSDSLVECPCHSSRFSIDTSGGACATMALVHGPAPVAPIAYPTVLARDGNSLVVDFGSTVMAAFSDYPQLMSPGGVAVITNAASCAPGIVVVRQDSSTALALSAVCTHKQCIVAYSSNDNDLECPCHGSRYDLDGNVLMGPATEPLAQLSAAIGANGITVTS
jgi:Rieske Fe-S protein